ncbi:MAG: TolC family protein [Treponema sp.]|nr:TolC family protein [Treponema sp.]
MKKIATLILIGCAAVSFTFAQADSSKSAETAEKDAVKLNLDEAVKYALENSRTLKSNDIDLEIKARASKYSWNVFLPTVQATGTMSRATEYSPSSAATSQMMNKLSGGMIPVKTDYETEEERWSTIGSVSASWNFTPAYIAQIKTAKAMYEAQKITWEQSQKETITNIKKAYYGLLLQQENLKIQRTTLENARQRMIQAQTNFRNGSIPELSYLQTQVSYENTKPDVDSAEQTIAQQIDLFAFLIGMPVGTKIEFTSSIDPTYVDVETDDLLAKYSENDLQIKGLEKNMLAAKLGMTALDMTTWFPTLALSYSYQPVYVGSEGAWHFYKDLGKDEAWYDSGSFSATLVWNLTNMLPWSSNRQKLKDTKQQVAQLELTIETLKENQKVQVRKAVDTLKQAKEQIDAMSRNVTVAQRAYDMTVRQYRNGTVELLDLRDAESSLNKTQLGLLNQKFQYISALMDLENTLNVDLSK